MKNCTKCNINKDLTEFSKRKSSKDGLNLWCKNCNKSYLKTYYLENKERLDEINKEHYQVNKESYLIRSKNYRDNNREQIAEYHEEYYEKNKNILIEYKKIHYSENKEEYLTKSKEYREENKEEYLNYLKEWRENNKEKILDYKEENRDKWVLYNQRYRNKLRDEKPYIIAWRSSLKLALVRMNRIKESLTIDLLGYSSYDLKIHMESLFKDGMSWDNWGEWHIDHIIPVSKFEPNTSINIVNALCNLQPLWAAENLSKNNKIL
jgi:hypothetical protein